MAPPLYIRTSEIRSKYIFWEDEIFFAFDTAKSQYCEIALLNTSDEVKKESERFISWAERNTGATLKRAQTDIVGDYELMYNI